MNAELELLDEDQALEGGQTVPMPASGAGVADLPRAERAVEELLGAFRDNAQTRQEFLSVSGISGRPA